MLGFVHDGERTLVEVEPTPDDVGYPRFKLLLGFDTAGRPHCLATYCAIGDRYRLLCSNPAWDRRAPAGV